MLSSVVKVIALGGECFSLWAVQVVYDCYREVTRYAVVLQLQCIMG